MQGSAVIKYYTVALVSRGGLAVILFETVYDKDNNGLQSHCPVFASVYYLSNWFARLIRDIVYLLQL